MSAGAMQGLRVLDHGHVWAGPLLGGMFADMGADVITIQAPHRHSGISMGGVGRLNPAIHGGSGPDSPRAYHGPDRNKRSATLDLSAPRGNAIYKELIKASDVVIENFSPGVMPRLGLGYDDLRRANPRIIMASLSATGATPGPWRDLVTYGPSLAALYGLKSVQGYQDNPQPREDTADLDPTAAAHAFVAICAALEYRDRTGRGQFIDIAQGEAALQRIAEPLMDYFFNGRVAGPQGNRYPGIAPHGVYRAAGEDAWVAIVVRDDAEWAALVGVGGGEEPRLREPRFESIAGRLEQQDALDDAIEAWTRRHAPMALTERLQGAGVAAFPVMGPPELLVDPNHAALRASGMEMQIEQPITPAQIYHTIPWKLPKNPGAVRRPAAEPGADNGYVYGELLGMSATEIQSLREAGTI